MQNSKAAVAWKLRTRTLDLTRPRIMGIVNVTPDSFSDGGEHATTESAVAWGRKLAADGADIIDVGGESTRSGAADVSLEEELARVIPVVKTLAREGLIVSVDTSEPEVMREGAAAGAEILNDIRGFREAGAPQAAAQSGCGLIVMHMQGTPRTMQKAPSYTDLIGEVTDFLLSQEKVLLAAGADPAAVMFDPGFGFGKNVEQNFELLAATAHFVELGRPFLMALSRKSSLGAVTGVAKAGDRIVSSVAGALIAVERGAQLVRVHDVRETKEAFDVLAAVRAAEVRLKD